MYKNVKNTDSKQYNVSFVCRTQGVIMWGTGVHIGWLLWALSWERGQLKYPFVLLQCTFMVYIFLSHSSCLKHYLVGNCNTSKWLYWHSSKPNTLPQFFLVSSIGSAALSFYMSFDLKDVKENEYSSCMTTKMFHTKNKFTNNKPVSSGLLF